MTFGDFAEKYHDETRGIFAFTNVMVSANGFWWVGIFPGFWAKLEELVRQGRGKEIHVAHDYTFNLTVQGFSYLFVVLVIYRCSADGWRKNLNGSTEIFLWLARLLQSDHTKVEKFITFSFLCIVALRLRGSEES